MYTINVVEDDLETAKLLASYLQQYAASKGMEIAVSLFSNAFDFLEGYGEHVDAVFLDIEMPGMTGMEAAKRLREKDSNVIIVFATNLAQFAIEGYSVNALDFILKPFSYPAMELKFDRIFSELSHKSKEATITLTRKDGVQIVAVNEICYVEVRNHSLIYHLEKKSITSWGSLSSAAKELAPHHFSLANACYLVNLRHVQGIEGNDVVVNGERLAISKNKRKTFLGDLALYYGGMS